MDQDNLEDVDLEFVFGVEEGHYVLGLSGIPSPGSQVVRTWVRLDCCTNECYELDWTGLDLS